MVSGKSPVSAPQKYRISDGTATGQQIATDALAYQGAGYSLGGAPANGIGDWDCSSFANWVIGHDLGLAIPLYSAGDYTGQSHGPTTLMWLAWTGCVNVSRSEVGAGDLCVWQTHMGIAISDSRMISAQNASNGTQVSGIDGFISGELLVCRRLKATLPPAGSPGRITSQGGQPSGSDKANQSLGRVLAASYGWGSGSEWTALDNIVMAESGWSDTAENPSGAAGIAQNINGFGPGYQRGNAAQQILWMLRYIKQRYGDPTAAWQFHLRHGYY